MVRNFVKWDHCLGPGEDIAAVFQEAFRIAATEPYGPVDLTLPPEVLWQYCGPAPKGKAPSEKKETLPPPDAAALDRAAEMLVKVKIP